MGHWGPAKSFSVREDNRMESYSLIAHYVTDMSWQESKLLSGDSKLVSLTLQFLMHAAGHISPFKLLTTNLHRKVHK